MPTISAPMDICLTTGLSKKNAAEIRIRYPELIDSPNAFATLINQLEEEGITLAQANTRLMKEVSQALTDAQRNYVFKKTNFVKQHEDNELNKTPEHFMYKVRMHAEQNEKSRTAEAYKLMNEFFFSPGSYGLRAAKLSPEKQCELVARIRRYGKRNTRFFWSNINDDNVHSIDEYAKHAKDNNRTDKILYDLNIKLHKK